MNIEKYTLAMVVSEDSLLDICETNIDEDEGEEIIRIDAKYADLLAKKLDKLMKKYNCTTILVPLEFRHLIYSMLSSCFNEVTVLAREEIAFYSQIEVYEEL